MDFVCLWKVEKKSARDGERGLKWISMSKTKLPLSRISSAASVSALFALAVIFSASIFLTPSPNPPVWRVVGGTSWLIKSRSSKPCCECWAPSSLFEQGSYSATFPPLMLTGLWAIGDYIMESSHNAFWVLCWGTNDSWIRCVWSPGSISRWLWWLFVCAFIQWWLTHFGPREHVSPPLPESCCVAVSPSHQCSVLPYLKLPMSFYTICQNRRRRNILRYWGGQGVCTAENEILTKDFCFVLKS